MVEVVVMVELMVLVEYLPIYSLIYCNLSMYYFCSSGNYFSVEHAI